MFHTTKPHKQSTLQADDPFNGENKTKPFNMADWQYYMLILVEWFFFSEHDKNIEEAGKVFSEIISDILLPFCSFWVRTPFRNGNRVFKNY